MKKESNTWQLKELTLEITYRCPLKCKHCSSYNKFCSPDDELTITEMNSIIDDFVDLGGELLEVSGGEPLCHPGVYEMMRYARRNGLKLYLYTCGVLRRGENELGSIDASVAEKLSSLKVDKVFINLQGASPEIHDLITGVVGSFHVVENSVKNLIEHGLYVGAHFVPMKPNFDQLERVIDYATKMEIKEVGVLRFVPQGRGRVNKKGLTLSRSVIARFMTILNRVRKRRDIKVRLGAPIDFCFLLERSHDPVTCTAGLDKCLVKANGDVIPCPAYKELPNYIAGNIRLTSLKKLWGESQVFGQFRGLDFRKLRGLCSKCVHLSLCRGRCPAQRILEWGDLYQGPNGYCLGS